MLTKLSVKQRDPFCFVIRLLSGSLSPQGTKSYARNLGWPTPHPFSLPQEFSKVGRQEVGIYEPGLMACIHGCFGLAYLPRTKLKDERILKPCIAHIIPSAITTAFPRHQSASPRAKLTPNLVGLAAVGGERGSLRKEILAEVPHLGNARLGPSSKRLAPTAAASRGV